MPATGLDADACESYSCGSSDCNLGPGDCCLWDTSPRDLCPGTTCLPYLAPKNGSCCAICPFNPSRKPACKERCGPRCFPKRTTYPFSITPGNSCPFIAPGNICPCCSASCKTYNCPITSGVIRPHANSPGNAYPNDNSSWVTCPPEISPVLGCPYPT
ncbi:hypothetical protein NDU88_012900 [Pleurodeles waltl]|uniref:Uncharacterized protein n=1 Tax=Pleurodeles waltl TaxID=8319 RepID=A0AAV7R5R0_PLEWA|nr:hypothetical protein NDU88_012900 [Pleurodeles waltl]